jgi:flavin-dependent dehydrogenase
VRSHAERGNEDRAEVLIVGGGPAGATCAERLRAGGLDVLVLDKAQFPRPKLCAGWVTPGVFAQLGLTPQEYAQGRGGEEMGTGTSLRSEPVPISSGRTLQPMTGFRVGWIGTAGLVVSSPQPMSYGIRRSELDDYLLRRSGARLCLGEAVRAIRPAEDGWIVNERLAARMLVAAGGHFCPVARLLDRADDRGGPLVVSQEVEFELDPAQRADCPVRAEVPEIYFCDDLLGYGWCIRKGNYLNVGLGRATWKQTPSNRGPKGDSPIFATRAPREAWSRTVPAKTGTVPPLPEQMARFCDTLRRQGRLRAPLPERIAGHAYLLYEQSTRPLVADRLVWIGDAAGLAYAESGEGIRPAIESGLLAAEAILAARGDYRLERLDSYRRRVVARFGPRRVEPPAGGPPSWLRRRIARWLLGRRWFVRRVLLDRWFLHAGQPPLELP